MKKPLLCSEPNCTSPRIPREMWWRYGRTTLCAGCMCAKARAAFASADLRAIGA